MISLFCMESNIEDPIEFYGYLSAQKASVYLQHLDFDNISRLDVLI